MVTVKEIYDEINRIAPFSLQESYDNSGLLVGSEDKTVTKVLMALDITKDVAEEAVKSKCDLVISHHPVIFGGLKYLKPENPAVILATGGVNAICMHTNFDSAEGGLNDILCKKLGLIPDEPLTRENGHPTGYICTLENEVMPTEMAKDIKNKLGNRVVRYIDTGKKMKRVAVCSGSGGSFLPAVIANKLDGYITGDVKHDVFIDAYNHGVCIFDAGHFYTESIFFDELADELTDKFPSLSITQAKSNKDIVSYEV